MKALRPTVSLTVIMACAFLLNAETATAQTSDRKPLFTSHDVLDVRIDAPLTTLMRDRPDEDYLDGTFTIRSDDGSNEVFDLKLRTRGNYRRQRSTCIFAPVRLNFQKKQVDGTVLDGQDKLKLVTHCNTRRPSYDQLVLREYLTYRIFLEVTDMSFGARLMRIEWADTEEDEPFTRWGFVIEDEDDIGKRLGMTRVEASSLSYGELDPAQTNLVMMYSYLIGNTDFSLIRGPEPEENDCCHNATPFSDGDTIMPIPYDFDHAGLVDAPYAAPNPAFKIRNVTTRVYRGRCSNNDFLDDTIARFLARQDAIMGIVDELELDDESRTEVVNYLDGFFAEISDPAVVERRFFTECS